MNRMRALWVCFILAAISQGTSSTWYEWYRFNFLLNGALAYVATFPGAGTDP